MASVKDLRDRIRSLKNTQQITKAMKQVAAAKIRRAEAAQKQARPYADALGEMLQDLIATASRIDNPFMNPGKAGAPSGVILMTSDKGLAGAFNSNVIREAERYRQQQSGAHLYTVGIKARNAVRRWGLGDRPAWPLNAPSKLQTAHEVARQVAADFTSGEIGDITLISSKHVSMMSQRPEVRRLVPIERKTAAPKQKGPRGWVEIPPSAEFVLSKLLPKYLEFTIFSAMLETDAAFYAAQLLAMNNARQAAITKELLEIVSGAEALTGT